MNVNGPPGKKSQLITDRNWCPSSAMSIDLPMECATQLTGRETFTYAMTALEQLYDTMKYT